MRVDILKDSYASTRKTFEEQGGKIKQNSTTTATKGGTKESRRNEAPSLWEAHIVYTRGRRRANASSCTALGTKGGRQSQTWAALSEYEERASEERDMGFAGS